MSIIVPLVVSFLVNLHVMYIYIYMYWVLGQPVCLLYDKHGPEAAPSYFQNVETICKIKTQNDRKYIQEGQSRTLYENQACGAKNVEPKEGISQ